MYFLFLLIENHAALHTLRIEVTVPIRRSSGFVRILVGPHSFEFLP
jgi:hypothetical protein